jgi:(p)ppGpp synthase/HD superfamily hydrolase
MSERPPCYSERLDHALAFVARAFRHRTRKGTQIPYLSHLLAVMVTVAEHGGDEDQMLAALLHDYLEDIEGADARELEALFGERVTSFVLALSDSVGHPKPPWEERKQRYVRKLADEPSELKLISAADKLHNARSLVRDHALVGEALWQRFTATRAQTLWYYRAMLEALGTGWQHALLDELAQTVAELERAAGEPSG